MTRSITLAIHGEPKVGKTTFGNTTPSPRLILDAEMGTEWLETPTVTWEPTQGPPPAPGDWETCIAPIRKFDDVGLVYQWLNAGQHHFRGISLDSGSEIQKRCIDSIAGVAAMDQTDWGELLRRMEAMLRSFRDLRKHPTRPIEALVVTFMTRKKEGDVYRPFLQGALETSMPYFFDVLSFLYVEPTPEGSYQRKLLTQPVPGFLAGSRVSELPAIIEDPNVEKMLGMIGERS